MFFSISFSLPFFFLVTHRDAIIKLSRLFYLVSGLGQLSISRAVKGVERHPGSQGETAEPAVLSRADAHLIGFASFILFHFVDSAHTTAA